MSRLSLPRLLLAGIAVLLLVLLLLWLLPDRSGQRRHQWAAPAATVPDLSAYGVATQRRPPVAAGPATASVSRSLFTPARRPPPPAPPAAEPAAAPPPPPPPDQLDKTKLLGLVSGRGLTGVIAQVDGDTRIVAPGPLLEARAGLRHYRADSTQGELSATVVERLCVDSMSAMPHPAAVEVSWQGQTLRGCGGEPMELLLGEAWQVVERAGARVSDAQPMTLVFGSDGRIAGMAACNRYSGAFSLSGEGLRLSQLSTTRMACAPALMDREQRFLAALGAVTGFAIGADGSLELKSGERVLMRARRK